MQELTNINDLKDFRVVLYDNKRVVVHLHEYNPFENKKAVPPTPRKHKDKEEEFMSKKDYLRCIRRWQYKL